MTFDIIHYHSITTIQTDRSVRKANDIKKKLEPSVLLFYCFLTDPVQVAEFWPQILQEVQMVSTAAERELVQ